MDVAGSTSIRNQTDVSGSNSVGNQSVTSKTYRVDLDLQSERVNELVAARSGAERILPDLVPMDKVRAAQVYKRFSEVGEKSAFRMGMLSELREGWALEFGPKEADRLTAEFRSLAENLDGYSRSLSQNSSSQTLSVGAVA